MAEPFIAAVKAGLAAVGFPVGTPRPPFAELDADAAARIAQLAETTPMEATMANQRGDGEAGGAPRPVHGRPPAGRRPPAR